MKSYLTESIDYNSMARPTRMEKPDTSRQGSYSSCWPGFYIGDQLRNILVDKYGLERGEKNFDDLFTGRNNNSIYTVCGNIMKEKYKMLQDMGEDPRSMDYWDCAYFPLWQTWVTNKGRKAVKTKVKQTATV